MCAARKRDTQMPDTPASCRQSDQEGGQWLYWASLWTAFPREALSIPGGVKQREAVAVGGLPLPKSHEKSFLKDCYWTVKNHGSDFSLLNNERKWKDGMFIDSLCAWCCTACFLGSDAKGKKNLCMSYSCRVQAPWCALWKYHRKIWHQIVCLRWYHFLLK